MPSSMKECIIMAAWMGLVVLMAVRTSSAFPFYGLAPYPEEDPFDTQGDQDHIGFKRGFWEKRSSEDMGGNEDSFGTYPFPVQWNKRSYPDKRGFGSMMPAYLMNMYRSDSPVLPPKSLFSQTRPRSDRGKRSSQS